MGALRARRLRASSVENRGMRCDAEPSPHAACLRGGAKRGCGAAAAATAAAAARHPAGGGPVRALSDC